MALPLKKKIAVSNILKYSKLKRKVKRTALFEKENPCIAD